MGWLPAASRCEARPPSTTTEPRCTRGCTRTASGGAAGGLVACRCRPGRARSTRSARDHHGLDAGAIPWPDAHIVLIHACLSRISPPRADHGPTGAQIAPIAQRRPGHDPTSACRHDLMGCAIPPRSTTGTSTAHRPPRLRFTRRHCASPDLRGLAHEHAHRPQRPYLHRGLTHITDRRLDCKLPHHRPHFADPTATPG